MSRTDKALHRVTEILDVAPVDIFHGLSKNFIDPLPDALVGQEHKAQAMDFQFHWVSEAGPSEHAKLTSGISLKPTVRPSPAI